MITQRRAFTLSGAPGQVNALRRALISDVPTVCPSHVDIHVNTTSHTDEYVAHRLGLVPFRQPDTADGHVSAVAHIRHREARPLRGDDVQGDLRPFHADANILDVCEGQELSCELKFAKRTGTDHARFARAVAVGMRPGTKDGEHVLSFETLFGDDHDECLRLALDALEARVRAARAVLDDENVAS